MSRVLVCLALIAPLVLSASIASADLPPPPGYVEKCTVAKQQKESTSCVLCGDAYFREPDACANRYLEKGYTKACQTRGASTWEEVWCISNTDKNANGDQGSPVDNTPESPPANGGEASPDAPSGAESPVQAETPPETRGCRATDGAPWGVSILVLVSLGTIISRRRHRVK